MKKTLPVIIFASFLLAACASLSNLPKPEQSEYFTTLGGGFVITLGNPPTYRYGVNLVITKTLPESAYAVVEFQNPADSSQPFVLAGPLEDLKKMTPSPYPNVWVLTSPAVQGISAHTNYAVIASIYSDSSRQTLTARHTQLVNSEYIQN
ncbi:hypothetical protein [Ectopseudomonas alcaliphila]|uniref:Lipoprotein n=1 Tax=Ectopseudomonas alcaliphila TaxID=101564 RepID=A0A1G7B3K1_9GAMM|nr:hypothetical protein [Pseudomonas alcaliphila]MDX5993265.1 hypothetical protein [Pseudomonas alcaliphila]SDE21603.1 hypothetical protein SAMN05216575_102123 [Pseudomonas alcaliphila]